MLSNLEGGEVIYYAVFSPTQIKSIHNRGTWDPEDPGIRRNPGNFGRTLLAEVMKEVRQRVSPETIRRAWAIRNRGYAEFHIPESPEFPEGFYYHDQEKSVAEIKAEGWEAALRELEVEDES